MTRHRTGIGWLFTATLFASAFLMFIVQPMFAKMALPRLGGTSAVWSLALVFFQAVLLLGYSYSHVLMRSLGIRAAVVVHLLVSLLAVVSLPIAIAAGWDAPPERGQAFWLLGLFAASVGLPFFALSANAPLLQAWYARTGQWRSVDPYFLYAASNTGSFLALLAYPFAIEPFLGLTPQGRMWGAGFVGLIVLIGLCGAAALRAGAEQGEAGRRALPAAPPVSWSDRGWWLACSALPTGLLVGATAFITMDVVAAPFLWVLPLAVYLLTFIIAFQVRPLIQHQALMARVGLWGTALAMIALLPLGLLFVVPANLLLCFVLMLGCHGELALRRPAVARLTEFYFFISLGGVLGGIFASLLAPNLFDRVIEYPVLVVACMALLGFAARGRGALSRTALLSIAGVPLMLLSFQGYLQLGGWMKSAMLVVWTVLLMSWLGLGRREPLAMACLLAAVIGSYTMMEGSGVLARMRSFYGVLTVSETANGQFHKLVHGTTLHGWQRVRNPDGTPVTGRPRAESYYYAEGPFGSAIAHLREARGAQGGSLAQVALVGMGIGSMICHSRPGEAWSFFEIDPQVAALAADPRYFTVLRDCGPPAGVTIGDGRLQLARMPDGAYDMIVLDAFSSDAIPAHLLTQEAMQLYIAKLKPGGIAVFHTSNRFLELDGVIEEAALRLGLEAWQVEGDERFWPAPGDRGGVLPDVVVVAKTRGSVPGFDSDPGWKRAAPGTVEAWTDDYSNIPLSIWRKMQSPDITR